jgi:hypothetical protein
MNIIGRLVYVCMTLTAIPFAVAIDIINSLSTWVKRK